MLAASGCPKMPKTPHSSLNLSGINITDLSWGPTPTTCAFAAHAARHCLHRLSAFTTTPSGSRLSRPGLRGSRRSALLPSISLSLRHALHKMLVDRCRPNALGRFDRHVDGRLAVHLDSQRGTARAADDPRGHAGRCRAREDVVDAIGRD